LFWLVLAFPGSSWLVLACTDKIWRSKCHHSDEVVAKHISGALICSGAYGTSRFSSDVDFWEISPKKYYNHRCPPEHGFFPLEAAWPVQIRFFHVFSRFLTVGFFTQVFSRMFSFHISGEI
jgi:hypothetical protein